MTSTRSILALLAFWSLATPTLAQSLAGPDEAVATAAHRIDARTAAEAQAATGAATPTPRTVSTADQIAAFLAASPAIDQDEGGVSLTPLDEETRRRIHGAFGVTVGTGGYRSAYVAAQIPIGESATLGLAYAQTDYGDSFVYPGLSDAIHPGRGWSGGRESYGRWGRGGRGGQQRSLAVSLAVGGEGQGPPEGCAPAFRVDGRYVEPLWVSRMRDDDGMCDSRAAARSR